MRNPFFSLNATVLASTLSIVLGATLLGCGGPPPPVEPTQQEVEADSDHLFQELGQEEKGHEGGAASPRQSRSQP